MIELIVDDEYGKPYAIETFLTVDDARNALNQMKDSLEDCTSSKRAHHLMCAIDQLEQLISDHE